MERNLTQNSELTKLFDTGARTEIINPFYKRPIKSHIRKYTVLIMQGSCNLQQMQEKTLE